MSEAVLKIEFMDKNGEVKTMKDFSAKAYLVVNVASKCGLTPQYEGLQNLYKKYHDKGLEILAFPANEFLAQEPGTDEEIQQFCSLEYNVTFPVNKKIIVKGEGQHPLYKFLTEEVKESQRLEGGTLEARLTDAGLITGRAQDIKWNFEKFLISADGKVIKRFFPEFAPEHNEITEAIEGML
ncbi:glutathione peroxidase [Bacteriovorax sp. Seq25_V]|uniref:glutathione peroxidase n=1 Tax=Bacteriovorax sp. Seq25_V TaxID=1201288 RepID=UPI00038A2710|nr:glutathione peroxidase [Bacteriovorax sp. Seq25_V]EQC47624.1 glutathione peroxidase [Bacteriovorax sp. Seq25_V]